MNNVSQRVSCGTRLWRRLIFSLASFIGSIAPVFGGDTAAAKAAKPPTKEGYVGQFLNDLLPIAWQKRPKLRFNVFTEMTPEGRRWRVPTSQEPLHYFSPPGTYAETGWLTAAGERPPPWRELQEAMRNALASNGYLPIANDQERPDVLITFNFGSHGTDIGQLADSLDNPMSAEELMNWRSQISPQPRM